MSDRTPAAAAASSTRSAPADGLGFYRLLASFGVLETYRAKFIAVAAVAAFLPAFLLVLVIVLGLGRLDVVALVVLVLLLALLAFAFLVRAIDGLLAPLDLAAAAVDDVAFERPVQRTDVPGSDTAAQVLRGLQGLAKRVERVARDARDAGRHDEVTGLASRTAGREQAQQMIDAETRRGRRVQVVVADVVGFRAFNARHGQGHGDAMLKVIAARIGRVGGDGAVAMRWSGDAFLLVQAGSADAMPDAHDLLGRPIIVKGAEEPLLLAVGTAATDARVPFDQLAAEAEAALAAARGRA